MEVVARLGTLLSPGTFSKQEDEVILAWVEEHGPTGWPQLAAELGRNYKNAARCVRQRYHGLRDRQEKKRMGEFTMEEITVIIREVIRQKPSALEDIKQGDIDWGPIAKSLSRPANSVTLAFTSTIRPTLRRPGRHPGAGREGPAGPAGGQGGMDLQH